MDLQKMTVVIDWLIRMAESLLNTLLGYFGKDWITTTTAPQE